MAVFCRRFQKTRCCFFQDEIVELGFTRITIGNLESDGAL